MTNEQNAGGQGSPPEVGPVKAVVIKVLRGTIALLETAVTKLETPPAATSGRKTSFPIPQAISNLPGWAKATVLATLALVTVWGVTALFPGQPAAEVAQIPSEPIAEITPTPPVEPGDQETGEPGDQETGGPGDQGTRGPGDRLPVSQSPSLPVSESPRLPVSESPSLPVSESPSLPVSESPSLPVSESPPLPVSESPTPLPETLPEPELQLTPEQVLIAAIESQVQNVTNKLGNGLIRSIQADFARSKLAVLLSNEWYNLTSDRQDQLASEMLVEARQLDFQTLEITDSERHLLARSPVVGSGMIIVRRSLPPNT